MKIFNKISRTILAVMSAVTILVSNPVQALAAGTWTEGINNGKITTVGVLAVMTYNRTTHKATALRIRANLYTSPYEYLQAICDQTNAMEYDVVNGWAINAGDHVNSTYTGTTIDGQKAKGRYQMWTWTEGDLLQIHYMLPNGDEIYKYWFLESVDTNAYYGTDGAVYFADGTNIDTYGLNTANKRNTFLMTQCWPNAWGSYPKTGCKGRVVSVFREDHTEVWDVYITHNSDGTVKSTAYGDYDIYTNDFVVDHY